MPINIEKVTNTLILIDIRTFTDDEFHNFVKKYTSLYSNLEENIVCIFSTLNLENISPKQIGLFSLFLLNMKPVHKKYLKHFFMILDKEFIVNLVNMVFYIIPPVAPYSCCKTLENALELSVNHI